MPTPAPSWNTHRVLGTWNRQDGTMRAGTYKATVPVRVTNQTDRVIIPAGVFAEGALNTTPGVPSLDILLPATDDTDNLPQGWQMVLEVTFLDAAGERYDLDLPVGGETDLVDVILTETLPIPKELLVRGVPGGIAELDADGDVVDAAGEKVGAGLDEAALGTYLTTNQYATDADVTAATSGLVPTTRTVAGKPLSGNVTLVAADVSDSTATGRSVVTAASQAAARTAIGAGTSNLALGTTSATAKAGDYAPNAAAITDSTTVGRAVVTATDATAARSAIGAGTSSLALGTTSSTAKAGDYQPTAANISDSTATGRSVLTAASAAAARTAIGAGTSSVAIGTTSGTAADAAAVTTSLAGKTATLAIGTATTSQRIVIVPTAGEYTGGQAGDIVLVLSV